jgi:hypothetical protein
MDDGFGDSDGYSGSGGGSWSGGGKTALTIKTIMMEHIRRCVVYGSTEFKGGYNQTIVRNNTPDVVVYVPNTREAFTNGVQMLRAVLLGYFDEKMTKQDELLAIEFKAKGKVMGDADGVIPEKNLQAWYSYTTAHARKMFEQLLLLAKRLNFFEDKTSSGDTL